MTPQEIRRLKVGQWLTFTPTIWSPEGIDGKIIGRDEVGTLYIEWDDGHKAIVKPDQLHSSKFQIRDE